MIKYFLLLAAVAIAVGRIFIVPRLTGIPSIEGSYEAVAHIIVGFLIIVPFYDRQEKVGPSTAYGIIGWALALWELGWFLVQKLGLLSLAALLVLSASASAQQGVTCCLPTWTPEQVKKNESIRRAFHQAQADSSECKRDGIGCPEGNYDPPPVKQKSMKQIQREADEGFAYARKLHPSWGK